MNEADGYITLNMLPKVGPVRVQRLVKALGSVEAVFRARRAELMGVDGVGPEVADSILGWEKLADPVAERGLAAQHGAVILTPADSGYPAMLRTIYDFPLALYVRGQWTERDRHSVAVVGMRAPSVYGREMARKLGYQLAYAGLTVISGLARGVDTHAHEGALAAKGRTVAVLGCGVDRVYPPENKALAQKIEATGAVLSEFPMGTKPDRQTFPMRNRIVSALSVGVVVVEAGKTSGALITARMAAEQGRHVFAIPGRVDTPGAAGCHALIREGARLVEGAADIMEELSGLFPREALVAPRQEGESKQDVVAVAELSPEERTVLECLGTDEISVDELIRKCGLPPGKVSASLARLEMRKQVKSLPGKFYTRVN
jgi:DNA processing protein